MDAQAEANRNEQLKDENEFLKMKLMLENGAKFGGGGDEELPAEVENMFLQNIIEFEKQFTECKTIRIFEKVGRPEHFKPVSEIPDEDISAAWELLNEHLNTHGVELMTFNPAVSDRELYRFTIEELFLHETDDIKTEGWITTFFYDEFHPDPVYETSRMASEECINWILTKSPIRSLHVFREEDLRLNEHYPLRLAEFVRRINIYKDAYDEVRLHEIEVVSCEVSDTTSIVKGAYKINAVAGNQENILTGSWKVSFQGAKDEFWYVNAVEIKGINF